MADTQVLEACASAWGFESPLPHHKHRVDAYSAKLKGPGPSTALMSQTITQPDNTRITLNKTADYRDNYANSVQVRLSVWDFFLVFGTLEQQAPDAIDVQNFQGIYLSPQQAKALQNVLNHNIAAVRRPPSAKSPSSKPAPSASPSPPTAPSTKFAERSARDHGPRNSGESTIGVTALAVMEDEEGLGFSP